MLTPAERKEIREEKAAILKSFNEQRLQNPNLKPDEYKGYLTWRYIEIIERQDREMVKW